jgi:hypothetical protein
MYVSGYLRRRRGQLVGMKGLMHWARADLLHERRDVDVPALPSTD